MDGVAVKRSPGRPRKDGSPAQARPKPEREGPLPTLEQRRQWVEKLRKKNRRFANERVFRQKAEEYFALCKANEEVVSEQGLALYLGVCCQTLRDWHDGKYSTDLKDAVKEAYDFMANQYIQLITKGDKGLVTFAIFILKQPRFAGYQDQVKASGDINVTLTLGKTMSEEDAK